MRYALSALLLLAATSAEAWEPLTVYESRSGDLYQYDLNRPADELRYDTDMGAQMRDEISNLIPNPRRDLLEETFGQRGGGRFDRRSLLND